MALNETLWEGGDIRDGREITSRMWNRDFLGEFPYWICILIVQYRVWQKAFNRFAYQTEIKEMLFRNMVLFIPIKLYGLKGTFFVQLLITLLNVFLSSHIGFFSRFELTDFCWALYIQSCRNNAINRRTSFNRCYWTCANRR